MANLPTVSPQIECAHCGESNQAQRTSCNMCGSVLTVRAVAPVATSLADGMSGLSEGDRLALMGYAEIAQLSPIAISSQQHSQGRSAPQMDVNRRPFGLKAMQMSGVAAFAMGLFFCSGNLFGFYPTVPFLGYLSMLVGGALWHSSTHISD